MSFGAVGTAAYTSPTCVETIKSLAGGPIRLALDRITNSESVATCFAAMARTGGRHACLKGVGESWRSRRAIETKVVMGFEGLGIPIDIGPTEYSRGVNQGLFEVAVRWAEEVQSALDAGRLKAHPVREVAGQWQGIVDGLGMIQRGEVRGGKLVVGVATL
ncbi:hypothetical protein FQN54_003424 [Arachnomyces sp. PD_36]|nr:hypothetical protein FQN54_003424 [Arachnomyces sp. PD_36]